MTHQAPQRISRHRNDSSGTTANLQTPQWLIRDRGESPDTTMTHQAPQWISRHHNAIQMTLQCRYFCCYFTIPSLQALHAATPRRGRILRPSVRLSDHHILSTFDDISFSVFHTNSSVLYCTSPGTMKFVQWRVAFVDPQCASGVQNFEVSPRFFKKYEHPWFTGTLKANLRIIIEDVSACR